jgi:hypothetical protein
MEYTEEQTADFEARAKAFTGEFDTFYAELKKKHECELVYGVGTAPIHGGMFGLGVTQNIGDTKHKSVPSPEEFVKKDA